MSEGESVRELKIALLGFRSVGKSALTLQFTRGEFNELYNPTIEDTYNKDYNYRRRKFRLSLVDTAGQDEYTPLDRTYSINNLNGYILVFAVNDRQSFEILPSIYDKIYTYAGNDNIPIVVVGNKTDLIDDRQVSLDDGLQFARGIKAFYKEVTAKDYSSVEAAFNAIIDRIDFPNAGSADQLAMGKKDKSCSLM